MLLLDWCRKTSSASVASILTLKYSKIYVPDELPLLSSITLPRIFFSGPAKQIVMHLFGDISQDDFLVVLLLMTNNRTSVFMRRARVAAMKLNTIPNKISEYTRVDPWNHIAPSGNPANAGKRRMSTENLQSCSSVKCLNFSKATHFICDPNTDVVDNIKLTAITRETDNNSTSFVTASAINPTEK